MASMQSGEYDFVGKVMTAFRTPGITAQTLYRFKAVAEKVERQELTKDEATQQIAALGNALSTLWKWTNDNGAALGVLIAIIMLYLQLTGAADAQVAADKQSIATGEQIQVERQIRDELRRLNATAQQAANRLPTPLQVQTQQQMPSRQMTRQQRRYAERMAKKRGPRA